MCGIVGYFNRNEKPVSQEMIDGMLQTIYHRGPDDDGSYLNANIGIGMRRLSIIDLKTGRQPISNEDGTLHIVFNGEIYNYIELRDELQSKGHIFKTDTDTETILHLFEEYGRDCVQYLNGMFGFAIWNDVEKSIFCARDHVGIKPFYYHINKERLVFASELKAILQERSLDCSLDFTALSQLLSFEFIPAPRTLINSIRKLPPGHWLYASDNEFCIEKYWHLEEVSLSSRSEGETMEELFALLKNAVKLQMRSDVPFGAFLSGGIDSGIVTAMMGELVGSGVKTFSIGFKNSSYNELKYAKRISEQYNTDHTEYILEPSSLDLIETLINHMDDPIGDFSIFPTYMVSKLAREKVKVILSGDGGDELFGGYDTYVAQQMYNYYSYIPGIARKHIIAPICNLFPPTEQKKGIVNKVKRYVEGAALPEEYEHFRWMTFLNESGHANLFTPDAMRQISLEKSRSFITENLNAAGDTGLNRSMFLDVKSYLVDNILVKVDRMSMATSLEARVPLLDKRVVELAFSIPDHFKLKENTTKYILKKVAKRLLPEDIITRPKQGFSIPIKNWLKGPIKPLMLDLLSHEKLRKENIFNPVFVDKMIKEHLENKQNHSHILWSLMLFQLWNQKFRGRE